MTPDFHDDNFDFDPAAVYPDANAVTLPQPGEYSVRGKLVPQKDRKTGQNVVTPDGFAVMQIPRIEIVDPEEYNGSYGVFKRVSTKPFQRGGRNASQMVDALRSIDVNAVQNLPSGPDAWHEAKNAVEAELASGSTMRVKLGYEATDVEGFKRAIDTTPEDEKPGLWNKYTYRNKAFRRADGKGYNTTVTTPEGRTLEAKLVITEFVASDKAGKGGPFFKS